MPKIQIGNTEIAAYSKLIVALIVRLSEYWDELLLFMFVGSVNPMF